MDPRHRMSFRLTGILLAVLIGAVLIASSLHAAIPEQGMAEAQATVQAGDPAAAKMPPLKSR